MRGGPHFFFEKKKKKKKEKKKKKKFPKKIGEMKASPSVFRRSSAPARSARAARPLCPSASFRAIAEPPAVPFTKSADHLTTWSPDSWRKRPAYQQPNYPDAEQVELAAAEIARLPPLVFAGECRTLQARLAKCASGEAFLLQGEISFSFIGV